MKYIASFNIWEMPVELLAHVQPGQWIYAGDKGTKGRFLGVTATGNVVVAWKYNKAQISALRVYAKNYAKK